MSPVLPVELEDIPMATVAPTPPETGVRYIEDSSIILKFFRSFFEISLKFLKCHKKSVLRGADTDSPRGGFVVIMKDMNVKMISI